MNMLLNAIGASLDVYFGMVKRDDIHYKVPSFFSLLAIGSHKMAFCGHELLISGDEL
jgi:hypothetical protein